jgi:RNA polymerase sigma factor (sigma-70 family)
MGSKNLEMDRTFALSSTPSLRWHGPLVQTARQSSSIDAGWTIRVYLQSKLGARPEDSYLDREQEQILSAALNKLRPGIRKAIELRELGELSTGETALVMGLSVAALKARVFHGRRKLRETLRQSPKVDRKDNK